MESLGFRQEMTLTVTSIKQVEHIIEVEFWNLQVFKIFKYFTSTVSCVSSIWLMLLKNQIHVIISKERLEHGKLCIFSSAVTTK